MAPLEFDISFKRVKQLKVLLDQEPQAAGKRPEDGEEEEEKVPRASEPLKEMLAFSSRDR
ncbi:hypothetical protein EYF80_055793 [Liparis tanakae]|uniref:Uncharacterized protein n=1 Tax=Liparis tanakae TaxID=230148 RepID=A0A4Z2F073_9TELE|nr:hypothetical protein EYF80_055793 [Liparis tanakae]